MKFSPGNNLARRSAIANTVLATCCFIACVSTVFPSEAEMQFGSSVSRSVVDVNTELRALNLSLEHALQELSRIFNLTLSETPLIQLVRREDVIKILGKNVQALYSDGIIYVAFDYSDPFRRKRAISSLRHEAVHAAISEISGSKCPAWVEEGLAQIFEGVPDRHNRLAVNTIAKPLPFAALASNFALLEPQQRVLAYAQSQFAVQTLINRYGMIKLRKYLVLLQDTAPPEAFRKTFVISLEQFGAQVAQQFGKSQL